MTGPNLRRVLSPRRDSPVAGRPLVNATLAANYATAALEPRAYRATNLAIHLLCALLLMGAVRRTLAASARWTLPAASAADVGFAVALVWVVHPLNSEVVNYVTQRTESLMALCLFATLYASARAHGAAPRGWQALAVLSCLLGMACKESMAVAPLLVVVIDGWVVYPSVAAAARARAPFYALLVSTWAALIALHWSGPRMSSAGFDTAIDPWTYLLNQAPIVVRYLGLSLWPRDLVVMYGAPVPVSLSEVWAPAALLAVLAGATGVALWRGSWLGAAGAWFFVALAPASSVVPIATEAGAERRMYVPLVAVVAVAVWAAARGLSGLGRGPRLQGAALVAVVAFLAAGTVARNAEYRTPRVLAQTVLDRRPSGYASHMMAEALIGEGKADEAVPFLRAAGASSPLAQYALGVVHFNAGRYADAYGSLDAFVRREPALVEVIQARVLMGKVRVMDRRWSDAVAQFREALRMNPTEREALALLAQSLFEADDFEAAIPAYERYLARFPQDLDARCTLGIALVGSGRAGDAIAAFRRNVELDPAHLPSRVNLAMALFDGRQAEAALPHAQEAVRLQPLDAERHGFLGRVLAALGRHAEARQSFERALRLDPGFTPPAREPLGRPQAAARE